jgi:hypothetical protein
MLFTELSEAMYHIERNGNAKIILTDLSIKLTRLIHKKKMNNITSILILIFLAITFTIWIRQTFIGKTIDWLKGHFEDTLKIKSH